jgi:hypothetical protein
MSHLGRRLSALIDGELGDAERDQVHGHLVSCDECRAEAAALRNLKRRVRGLSETPADDGDLTRRLIALGGLPEPDDPPRSRLHGATRARAALAAFSGGASGRSADWDEFAGWFAGAPAAAADASPLAAGPLGAGHTSPDRSRGHTRYVVAGAVAALAVGLSAASFAAGGGTGHLPGPTITPQVDVFNMQHALTTGGVAPVQQTAHQTGPRSLFPRP